MWLWDHAVGKSWKDLKKTTRESFKTEKEMLEKYSSSSETSEDLYETVTQSLATLSPLVMWKTDKGINEPVRLAGMTSRQNVNILLFKQP